MPTRSQDLKGPESDTHQESSSMSKSAEYFAHADNCAVLGEEAVSVPARRSYKRMEASWRALAEEQRWLDGEARIIVKFNLRGHRRGA
jgi:hypothetical protein